MLSNVVEQHDRTRTQFGQPSLKIVTDGLIGVQAVDVQQVDGAGPKLVHGHIKCGPKKPGETIIQGIVVKAKLVEDSRTILTGVCIALPGVDGHAACLQLETLHSLAKGTIRD